MTKSPGTEPSTIIVSMTLTAGSAAYIDIANLNSVSAAWRLIFSSIIFIFAGTSATQLYFSLIIPKIRNQINCMRAQERANKRNLLRNYIRFYLLGNLKFLIARCTINEIRMLGYLNGFMAFFILLIVQFIHIIEKSFLVIIFLLNY